jgi:hypothetical protein
MAAVAGITPLEVMLEAMNAFRQAGDMEKAAGFAKDAAPYIHPRLAAVDHKGTFEHQHDVVLEVAGVSPQG